MASLHGIDDVISDDSGRESDMDSSVSSDDWKDRQRTRRLMTSEPEPEVVAPTPQPLSKRQRKPTAKLIESGIGNDAIAECQPKATKKAAVNQSSTSGAVQQHRTTPAGLTSPAGVASKKDRLLLREWLAAMANGAELPNVQWYDKEHTMIRIPWKHGSRSGWTVEDCQLYRAWAMYTGKYNGVIGDQPKRWKANFRCAMNSLPDVEEVTQLGQTRGSDPFKVYKLSPAAKCRKSPSSKKQRRTKRNTAEDNAQHNKQLQQQQYQQHQLLIVNGKTPTVFPTNPTAVRKVTSSGRRKPSPTAQSTIESDQIDTGRLMSRQSASLTALPLSVTSLHLAQSVLHSSRVATAITGVGQVQSSLPTGVIPTVVEEMSCDEDDTSISDDDEYNGTDVSDNSGRETYEAVYSLLNQQMLTSRHRRETNDSECSSGYLTDSFSLDQPTLGNLDFDLADWCNGESDVNVVPQLDDFPEISTDLVTCLT